MLQYKKYDSNCIEEHDEYSQNDCFQMTQTNNLCLTITS